MESARFDRLARFLADPSSRRWLLASGAGGIAGLLGMREITGTRAKKRGKGRPKPRPCRGLRGGIVAAFDVDGERFRVWVTNPLTIQQILDLQDGSSEATIPNGRLLPGPGRRRHNTPWHWHLDPQEIEMAEATIELCDARPTYIEANRDEFIAQVGRYCPWAARLDGVADCR